MAREADAIIMQQCLALARSVEGRTAPNPMVAAIVLDENAEVVGRGCHERTGMPHAERNALLQAGDRARGGTIYVSLEPCCHQGKTPPCTDALIESGVKKVVAAMEDPNPKVSGKGFSILKDNGIEVVENVLSEEAAWLNRGFISGITRGRPWLLLKMAMTLDGRIADRNGQSRWITGPEARAYVHDLRNRFDAVLVGTGTIRSDDPSLNVRDLEGSRDPLRVILDPRLSLPEDSRVFQKDTGGDTLVYCLTSHKMKASPTSAQLIGVGSAKNAENKLDLSLVLSDLGKRGIRTVLCEGGARLAGELIAQNLVDETVLLFAPLFLPDSRALPVTISNIAISLGEAKSFELIETRTLGSDVLIHAKASR